MKREKIFLEKLPEMKGLLTTKFLWKKTGDPIKKIGTLYDLLIDLLSEETSIDKPIQRQEEMKEKIKEIQNFVLLEEKSIKKN